MDTKTVKCRITICLLLIASLLVPLPCSAIDEEPEAGTSEPRVVYEQPQKRAIGSFTIANPARLRTSAGKKYNLRQYAGEGIYGYAIVQGSCTDGTYSYHCMININTNWGKIVKVRMSDGALMGVSAPYNFNHGNGMCYDSKRHRLVVTSYTNLRRTVTFVNPDTLTVTGQGPLNFADFKARLSGLGSSNGASAITYNRKYDCYVAMQKTDHNIIIYDAETLTAKAVVLARFDSSLTGTFQSIDSDDTYVYYLLSNYQGTGKIVAFDWHAEKLAALLSGATTEDIWWCGNGDGRHAALITVNGMHEIESMYHIDAGGGRGHFYLVDYNNDPKFKTVKYKVKWKKVKKKVKVKWKKVKKKVRWKKVKTKSGKKKWKYKTKKVWKYKYKKKKAWKYKTKKKRVLSHYNRDNYIVYLGEF